MFNNFTEKQNDPILALIEKYKTDTRVDKIDVGVGVFKDKTGNTPILSSVLEAEQRLLNSQTTKTYLGLAGNLEFNQAMTDLILGGCVDESRIKAVQTPGGSGALRISAEILSKTGDKTIWVSNPTWANHRPTFESAGLTVKTYPYLNTETKKVDEVKMLEVISTLGENDILLVHGCCHNPTGANISFEAWQKITELANQNGFLPFIDLAYQGFGDGLDEDVKGLRFLAGNVPELVITSSCSKNFGLYRERVGCAIVIGRTEKDSKLAQDQLTSAARVNYSMPPDHGAAVVSLILNSPKLRLNWEEELKRMRTNILSNRIKISEALATETSSEKWNFIAEHRGMFSLLCMNETQTDILANEHSIYIVSGGRVNIAGLKDDEQITRFASCLKSVAN